MTIFAFQNDQFAELAKLMDIGATFLASSTDCERGFSLMNILKTKLRNRLQLEHLEMLMCIKSYLQDGGWRWRMEMEDGDGGWRWRMEMEDGDGGWRWRHHRS